MKTRNKRLIAGGLLAIPTAAVALALSGDSLNIYDPAGSANGAGDGSGAIGNSNTSSIGSLAVGWANDTNEGSTSTGFGNIVDSYSLAVGVFNVINTSPDLNPRNSAAIGKSNGLAAEGSLVVGNSNSLTGTAGGYVTNSALIGTGLDSSASGATVVGVYNTDQPDVRFVVGNGDANTTSNALEVYDDGRVVVPKAQGDVSMGAYSAP